MAPSPRSALRLGLWLPLLFAPALAGAVAEPAETRPPPAPPCGPAAEPLGATLERLHAGLAGLPGFVDVQFVLQGPPRFVALFEGAPPPTLPPLDAQLPLTMESLGPLVGTQAPAAPTSAADPPPIPAACPGVRPGVILNTPVGQCTLAWIVRDTAGRLYATSAGHCFRAVGDRAGNFGRVAWFRNDAQADFALITIDPEDVAAVNPAMCHWGGATGAVDDVENATLVRQYGFGVAYGASQVTRPRTGVFWSIGVTRFSYLGLVNPGDSGSPVRLDEGPALGILTNGFFFASLVLGTKLTYGMSLAERALGIDLELVPAPVA